jgi:hypothetical protein
MSSGLGMSAVWRRRIIVAGFALLGIVLALAIADRANPPDLSRYENASPEVVARDGALLRPFLSSDGYWRLRTTVRDVAPRYLVLLKAYEDRRFEHHIGVDPFAMLRAVSQLVRAGHVISGGSTLTMQAARLLEPRPRGFVSKLFQMVRALQLEERYSKEQILSIYLTLAPFGGNLEGVRAASLAYFGKEPDALDLSESALLVALPQSPARKRPDRHAIAARAGRDKVLARMVADGVVSAADANLAGHEGVASLRLAMPLSAPHLAQRLLDESAVFFPPPREAWGRGTAKRPAFAKGFGWFSGQSSEAAKQRRRGPLRARCLGSPPPYRTDFVRAIHLPHASRGGGKRVRRKMARLLPQPVQRLQDRGRHPCCSQLHHVRLHDVRRAQSFREHALDRVFEELRVGHPPERIAQAHRERENAGDGIGEPLAGDIRRAAVDRFVKRRDAAVRVLRAQ